MSSITKWSIQTVVFLSACSLIFALASFPAATYAQSVQRPQPQPQIPPLPADVPASLWNADEEFRWMYQRHQDLVNRTARLPTPGTEDFRNYRANIAERDNLARNIRNIIQTSYQEEMQKKADEIKRLEDRLREVMARETAIRNELQNPKLPANRRQQLQNELNGLLRDAAYQREKQQAQNNLNTAITQYNNLFQSFLRRGGDRSWRPTTTQSSSMNQSTSETQFVSYTEESGMGCLSAAISNCSDENPCNCSIENCTGEDIPANIQETLDRMAEACRECQKLQGQPSPGASSSVTV